MIDSHVAAHAQALRALAAQYVVDDLAHLRRRLWQSMPVGEANDALGKILENAEQQAQAVVNSLPGASRASAARRRERPSHVGVDGAGEIATEQDRALSARLEDVAALERAAARATEARAE